MITLLNSVKNNSINFKGTNTEVKTVSAPVKNTVNNKAKTVFAPIKDTLNNEAESSKKTKKASKIVGLAIGTAIASAIFLRRPIKRHKFNKEIDKIEKTIHQEVEEKVSSEIKKYNKLFEKTKASAKAEVKDLLVKSKKDSSLVDKLTDGEVNTIVAVKKNLAPAAVPILIATLAKHPDKIIRFKPESDNAKEFKIYLSDLEKTSENPLEYVDSKNKTTYELQRETLGYGYSTYNNSRFLIKNNDIGYSDVRDLGIVLDSDKESDKNYTKNRKAVFAALIINNILYKNEENSKKRLISRIIQICKNNENNEKENYQKNCDFIADDIREHGNRRIEKEKRDRIQAEKEKEIEKERKRKEFIKALFCADSTNTSNHKKDSFDDDEGYYNYMKSKEDDLYYAHEHDHDYDYGHDDDDAFDDDGMY